MFLPGESPGHKSLVGYSPWGHKESRHNLVTEHICSHLEGLGVRAWGRWDVAGDIPIGGEVVGLAFCPSHDARPTCAHTCPFLSREDPCCARQMGRVLTHMERPTSAEAPPDLLNLTAARGGSVSSSINPFYR